MDARSIDILATLDPSSSYVKETCAKAKARHGAYSPVHQMAATRLLNRYGKVNFGWYIADSFAQYGRRFPIPMLGRDAWVFRAYLMQVDPWRNFDAHVAEAFHFSKYLRGRPDLGATLRAALLSISENDSAEEHLRKVSQRTGIPYKTVDAFEVLFYNILDRHADYCYIAADVYPNGRLVELDENYLKNSTTEDIIKRAGYNFTNLDMTAYLLGIGDRRYISRVAAATDVENELEKMIIGNGLIFSHTSLLNQRSVGLSRSQALIVARRQSGQTTEDPPLAGLSPLFDAEFQEAVAYSQAAAKQRLKMDAGELLDVEAYEVDTI